MGIGKTPEGDSFLGWFTVAKRRFCVALNTEWCWGRVTTRDGISGWFIGPLCFVAGRVNG